MRELARHIASFAPQRLALALASASASIALPAAAQMPPPLVFLRDIDPTIRQDIRYAGTANFTGRVVPGYESPECVLLPDVAAALALVQRDLAARGLSLLVYDCYRPRQAVAAFWKWAQDGVDDPATAPFHPRLAKSRLHSLGYVARTSSHAQANTVDLTIMPLNAALRAEGASRPCHAEATARADGSLDMGTGFDCFDSQSHAGARGIDAQQADARRILADAMRRRGFKGYFREWWHFSYATSEGNGRSFDAPIKPRPQ